MAAGDGWVATKRSVYLGCLGLAAPMMPLVIWLRWDEEPLMGVSYGVLASILALVFVGLAFRVITTAVAEWVILGLVPLVWTMRLAVVLYLQPDLAVALTVINRSIGPGFMILSIIAYLALPARRGLLVAGGFLAVSVVIVLPRVTAEILDVGFSVDVMGLLRVGLTTTISVSLLYALASLKEHLAREQLQAEVNATLARTDQLTGLLNRRAILERLQEQVATAERHGRPLSLAVFDVDRFKLINDRAGHLAGDQVLTGVADTITEVLRDGDIVGRWGGDELIVLLPETTASAAVIPLERVLERVSRAVVVAGPEEAGGFAEDNLIVTLSVGVAQWTVDGDRDDLLARADRALYRAKSSGRNQVAVDGVELAEA